MARFKKIKVLEPSWDSVCIAIRNALAASESVEVVGMLDGRGGIKFEVRAWNDLRKDKSNAEDASENKDY
jgi:hypothetical protein